MVVNNTNNELPYWVALAYFMKIGPQRLAPLRQFFKTPKEIWEAPLSELKKSRLDEKLLNEFVAFRTITNPDEKYQAIIKMGLGVLTIDDETYPKLLKQIYDPPFLLFYRGDITCLQKPSLAVVGTRRATPYGLQITQGLVDPLARAGLVIISGLAYGIDAVAHRSTLLACGTTIAVLASGLDTIYPTANLPLAQDIVNKGGLLLSEFPPGAAPLKQNFPFRNRIIAGLARGTLVIEAALGSGSLITAKSALEANREVFSVPGNIMLETAQGTNDLLKAGAHLVTDAQDILDVFGLEYIAREALPSATPEQNNILNQIESEPIGVDELVKKLNLAPSAILSELTMLELSGHLKKMENGKYLKVM